MPSESCSAAAAAGHHDRPAAGIAVRLTIAANNREMGCAASSRASPAIADRSESPRTVLFVQLVAPSLLGEDRLQRRTTVFAQAAGPPAHPEGPSRVGPAAVLWLASESPSDEAAAADPAQLASVRDSRAASAAQARASAPARVADAFIASTACCCAAEPAASHDKTATTATAATEPTTPRLPAAAARRRAGGQQSLHRSHDIVSDRPRRPRHVRAACARCFARGADLPAEVVAAPGRRPPSRPRIGPRQC